MSEWRVTVKTPLPWRKALNNDDRVAYVIYPGLEGDKYYDTCAKVYAERHHRRCQLRLKGGREAAESFMKKLKIAAIETHVADARTCCLHPASTTHRQMTDDELTAAGVPSDLVRFSCGLESSEDLIADIKQALDSAEGGKLCR